MKNPFSYKSRIGTILYTFKDASVLAAGLSDVYYMRLKALSHIKQFVGSLFFRALGGYDLALYSDRYNFYNMAVLTILRKVGLDFFYYLQVYEDAHVTVKGSSLNLRYMTYFFHRYVSLVEGYFPSKLEILFEKSLVFCGLASPLGYVFKKPDMFVAEFRHEPYVSCVTYDTPFFLIYTDIFGNIIYGEQKMPEGVKLLKFAEYVDPRIK